ncbi:MAG: serine/threonine protein kinase [Planctomycetes bacterium]|nr:serine/threonine protein kinase [Planctomycetota bacterium]
MPPPPPTALTFGEIAVALGLTTRERVAEALLTQEQSTSTGATPRTVGEILVERGVLTANQVQQVLVEQARRVGKSQIAGYRLLEKIGQGAMGAVFKAKQMSMDRIVAVKILAPKFAQNSKFVEQFFAEARSVARLNHPNIIQGIDVGEANGLYYFVMEYVDGPTVGDLLRRGGALDQKRALQIILQIVCALNYAQKYGLVHRDIKPDNIMLTRAGLAKLCDLGLAKLVTRNAPSRTDFSGSLGTPSYISPEQARGEQNVDTRSDLYSLGASFYHMVVGDVPFPADSAAVAIAKHLTEEPIPPRERNGLVSEGVNMVVLRLMRKKREDRYPSPGELLKDLEVLSAGGRLASPGVPAPAEEIVEGIPVAPPPPLRVRRSARRRLRR